MCWAACDRLANAARTLGLEDRQAFWQDRADTIRATIESRAARDGNRRLSATFGGDDIDASLLQLLDLRFLSPDDSRFRTTLAVVVKAMRRGTPLLRYATADYFGLLEPAFNSCTISLIVPFNFTVRQP